MDVRKYGANIFANSRRRREGTSTGSAARRHEAGHTQTDEDLQRAAATRKGGGEIIGVALLSLCPPLRTRWSLHRTPMRIERSPSLSWRFRRSGPPQTHRLSCLFEHSLGPATYRLVGVGQRSYVQHPLGFITATEIASPGAAQELLQALVQGVSLLMALLTLGHSLLDLSHATFGAFDAVATL